MWKAKLKEQRGGSTILEVLVAMGVVTFLIFYPFATFSMLSKTNLLEDVETTALQMAAVQGGLTDQVANVIYENMEAKSLLPENSTAAQRAEVILISNADARGGNTGNLKFRDNANSKISIEIYYPADAEVTLMNGLSRLVGADAATEPFQTPAGTRPYFHMKGYILSEKIDY